MIKSFSHQGLENFFLLGSKKGIQAKHATRLNDILDLLDAASKAEDMNFPGSGLQRLKGDLLGKWSLRVSGNWRLVFEFNNGDAFKVDYIDYH